MSDQHVADTERLPDDGPLDETDVSLRAYFTRIPDEHLQKYASAWSDDQVVEWDGNFRSDGALMLTCCERDVDIVEYRQVLERFIAYRRSHFARTPGSGKR